MQIPRHAALLLVCSASALISACGGTNSPATLATLNGDKPIVVAHRGASGYLPEETYEAYVKAIELGADAIEPDLVSTKDGVLIARHDPNLAFSTDVASHPEFASRKKTMNVDGEIQTNAWAVSDFTFAEIKTLGGISTDAERPQQFNGLYKLVSFQEIIDLVKAKAKETGRVISVYPETKNPSYHRALGLPLEDKLIAIINQAGWNDKTAPIYVQSFEPGSLKELRAKGLKTKLIQLIDADDVDLKTGKLTYAAPYDKPADWALTGDKRMFSDMVTPAGLAEIKTYADGIGPWKRYIVSIKGTVGADGKIVDINADGKINDADTITMEPTSLIADAHKAGLMLHPYTFRNEKRRLASNYKGDPKEEYKQFFRLGVDGIFSDFTDTALTARAEYLKETGR